MKTCWFRVIKLLLLLAKPLAGLSPIRTAPTQTWTYEAASTNMPWTPMVDTQITVVPIPTTAHFDLLVIVLPSNSTATSANATQLQFMGDIVPMTCIDNATVIETMLESKLKSLLILNGTTISRILVLELPENSNSGDTEDDSNGAMLGRKVGESVVTALNSEMSNGNVKSCGIVLPKNIPNITNYTTSPLFLSECTSTILSGLYKDIRYKGKVKEDDSHSSSSQPPKSIEFITSKDIDTSELNYAVQHGKAIASGVYLAKDIVNAPHNSLNSDSLVTVVKTLVAQSGGRLSCQILDVNDCEKRGMGAFLGVARGSETPPRLIHLTYRPKQKATKTNPWKKLGVIGKGLLFDTGGYSIKTAMMELMKFDCGGAAAVLGAAMAVAALQPQGVEVHFVIAACENMINERAVVPGDVLTAANGKTIEVVNTDAEGRLTMADALVYVDKEVGCDTIIELSTLTGSCIGALGTAMSGVWTDDAVLLETLKSAAHTTGEKLWHMPLEKSYCDEIQSKIADLKNIGGKYAGAITAALFLTNFVDKKPFAHIDMAGPVWSMKTGATGWGTKLVTEWVCRHGT